MNKAEIPRSPLPSSLWKISDRPRNLISASKELEREKEKERSSHVAAAAGVTGICKLGSAGDSPLGRSVGRSVAGE